MAGVRLRTGLELSRISMKYPFQESDILQRILLAIKMLLSSSQSSSCRVQASFSSLSSALCPHECASLDVRPPNQSCFLLQRYVYMKFLCILTCGGAAHGICSPPLTPASALWIILQAASKVSEAKLPAIGSWTDRVESIYGDTY